MAITSTGYDGTVVEASWSKLSLGLGSQYGVLAEADWRVTAKAAADRTIVIASGNGYGHGVLDTNSANVELQGAVVSTGSRYDMVVMRRNWSTNTSAFVLVTGGTNGTILPTRNNNPGSIDDQPVALVRFDAGATQPGEIISLRVWQANGGATALNELTLQYLTAPGTRITVRDTVWTRVMDANGITSAWRRDSLSSVQLFGMDSGVSGVTPDPGFDFKIQAGTIVAVSDSLGYIRKYFPKPFPGGCVTVVISGGDAISNPGVVFAPGWHAGPAYNNDNFVYQVRTGAGLNGESGRLLAGYLHRVNWIAIGW